MKRDGISVDVRIYCVEGEREWVLEVINEAGTSIVWDDLFPCDDAAWNAFSQTLAEEGMATFLDRAKVIPFRR